VILKALSNVVTLTHPLFQDPREMCKQFCSIEVQMMQSTHNNFLRNEATKVTVETLGPTLGNGQKSSFNFMVISLPTTVQPDVGLILVPFLVRVAGWGKHNPSDAIG